MIQIGDSVINNIIVMYNECAIIGVNNLYKNFYLILNCTILGFIYRYKCKLKLI